MNYYEVDFTCGNSAEREILLAEMTDAPFESFEEEEKRLKGYIAESDFDKAQIQSIVNLLSFDVSWSFNKCERINWNEKWESNFEPVTVENLVHVRATFHEAPIDAYEETLVIEPKMSFGTGHHDTTYLMMKNLFAIRDRLNGTEVLDMGCGTGILAILAMKLGAVYADAIDIDPWCVENTNENCLLNNIENISVSEGTALALTEKEKYHILIANINRNILLQDMDVYYSSLKPRGLILFSGLYAEDEAVLHEKASNLGLKFVSKEVRNNWLFLMYTKNERP